MVRQNGATAEKPKAGSKTEVPAATRNRGGVQVGNENEHEEMAGKTAEVTAELREHAAEEINELDEGGQAAVSRAIKQRRASRLIKPTAEKATSLKDAVVLTKDGDVDFRIAENAAKFKPDPLKTLEGDDDQRFLENRPDLQKVKASRGGRRANRIFTPDMDPDFQGK